MDKKGFIVDADYTGYVFVGWATGFFETEAGTKQAYFNMFVFSPVSAYQSDDYMAYGYKAEKKRCISAGVWKDLKPGDKVTLFFDDKQRVVKAVLLDY